MSARGRTLTAFNLVGSNQRRAIRQISREKQCGPCIDLNIRQLIVKVHAAIEIANVDSDEELANLAKKTYVLITTVGPYSRYGETALKACAQTGTHYLDVTGEFPWVARMIKKYEKTAQNTGALLFPQIGVESAPPDLCTWALAKGLREELGAKTKDAIISIHTLKYALPSILSLCR